MIRLLSLSLTLIPVIPSLLHSGPTIVVLKFFEHAKIMSTKGLDLEHLHFGLLIISYTAALR